MMGTSTCWGIIHRGEGFAQELVSMPHVVDPETLYYTWAGSATSGALVRWFRDQLGRGEVLRAGEEGRDPYSILDEEAAAVPPGCEGLVALPYFMGERAPLWDPEARGAFVGLTLSHTRAHLFRALLEAGAYSLRHAIEAGVDVNLPVGEETVVVGGAAKSTLWLQIIADITGRPIRALRGGVGAPLADALLVGLATGLVEAPRAMKEWITYTDPIRPDPGRRSVYERYYRLYRRLYHVLADTLHELSRLSQEKTR
jgi:xylulokinase